MEVYMIIAILYIPLLFSANADVRNSQVKPKVLQSDGKFQGNQEYRKQKSVYQGHISDSQRTKYTRLEVGSLCSGSLDQISKAGDCVRAANALNLEFGALWDGPGDFSGCLHANDGRNRVYFNISPMPSRVANNRNYTAICKNNYGSSGAEESNCFEYGIGYSGTSINNGLEHHTDSAADCQKLCLATPGCNYFSWADSTFPDPNWRSTCWLKSEVTGRKNNGHFVSGPKSCSQDYTTTTVRPVGDCRDYVNLDNSRMDFFYLFGYMMKQAGKSSYEQIGSEPRHVLKYQAGMGWVVTVSDSVDDILAYTEDPARCVYEATSPWFYLAQGEWLTDSDLRARLSPEEQCNKGAMCAGCNNVLEHWCCANECDYGWIVLGFGGGCVCGH